MIVKTCNAMKSITVSTGFFNLDEIQAIGAEFGFFDRKILQNHGVLTSKEIQTRFFKANRKGIGKPQYLLVDPTPPAPVRRNTSDKKADGHCAGSSRTTDEKSVRSSSTICRNHDSQIGVTGSIRCPTMYNLEKPGRV